MKKMIMLVSFFVVFSLISNNSLAETVEGYFVDQQVAANGSGASGFFPDTLFAQSFVPAVNSVAAVSGFMFDGNYSDVIVEIRPDDGGFPGETILGSSSLVGPLPPFGPTGIIFDPSVPLVIGNTYYIVFYKKPGAPVEVKPSVPDGDTYPPGQAYYQKAGNNWMVGVPPTGNPWWDSRNDYFFKEYFYGEDIVPTANAGPNARASANQIVILDGSLSNDPDGTIVNYEWRRLPRYLGDLIYSGPEPTCESSALGRAEELIQLTVTDNFGATHTDTMHLFWKRPPLDSDSGEDGEAQTQP